MSDDISSHVLRLQKAKADIAELFVVNEYNVIWLKCLIKTAKTYFGYYDMFIDIQNDIVEILPNKSWVKSASLLVKKEDQCNYAKCSPRKQQDYRWIKIDYLYHQGLSDEQIVEKYLGSVKKYYIFLYEKNKNPATLMEKTLLGK